MASRTALNPNAPVPSPAPDFSAQSEWASPSAEEEKDLIRAAGAAADQALRETMTTREAEARADVPITQMDRANPNKARSFPGSTTERPMLSSNMKKDYNKTKRSWVTSLPQTRHRAMSRTMSDRQALEGVNRELQQAVGRRDGLRPAIDRRVHTMDLAIADFEKTNERQHIVYATLQSPKPHGNSRNALRRRLEALSAAPDDAEGARLTFDGYIPASHSLGNVPEGPEIVMEIRTRSGAYLGTSDTTPNADHIVGRGRELRPRGVHEVTYVRPDGTRGTRWVVQMDDVTPTNPQ